MDIMYCGRKSATIRAVQKGRKVDQFLLTVAPWLNIIQIKRCSWGVQTALLLFPTFQKMEPGSIVRLCHAPVEIRQGKADAGGRAPTCFNSG